VIKAARVQSNADIQALAPFHTDFHLLDSYIPGVPGGTGETFAWDLAVEHRRIAPPKGKGQRVPLILSGGLTPENVGAAIELVSPFAVDVASGVESAPGYKDHDRMRAFEAVAASVPAAQQVNAA
jgi:phosphoribosylanthranilate isomerase